ncbi:carbohydrate ABC transporter permease [Pseudoleptotrichia goodfellowii]|uniref:ABC transporter, permease protein n=2 Tax=Pseudoleptotrichia goodfellowii TaxID=157692 RepID=D0GLZ3_9FUSO|nr:sugar ABC transporter permease [Pseudoleptotrichia goodfellowii]EEY34841.1 ABC transporter, permease protein [Pseudoleptotrichia goodfellowii F0264]MBF4805337.1 sugar ABC transporter permease [Pseudoleptotrichia goodfellowii]BBM35931.1 ABC transporter, permease protein [Pseudoleptotrichia goodfellowii]
MKKDTKGIFLLFPSLILLLISVIFPVILTFRYSLKNYNLTEPYNEKFIWFDNYIKIFKDAHFYNALYNSVIILILVMIIGMTFSIIIGVVLNRKSKINPLLTALVVIPWAMPPIVNGIMWKFIFFPGYGFMNKILLKLHLINTPISWTDNRYLFLIVISIVVAWRIIPFSSLVILANLQNIPESYYDTVQVFGGTKLQSFFYVTLPLLLPSIGVVLINLTTTALNIFDEVIAISGYQFEIQTLLVYNYSNTFNFLDFGYGSAISYVIMLISGIFGYFYVKNMAYEK